MAIVAALGVVAAVLVVPGFTERASAASAKVTICHRTHSTTNPYRRITVSQNAITRNQGHKGHVVSNGNPAVYDAGFTYASNNKIWGDIVPGNDADGLPYNGANNIAVSWTAAGKALFFSATCGAMSAKEFYDVEIAAGVPEADVLADLNSQSANEDAALLAALGGSFTAGNVTSWDTAVSVTTVAASSVGSTTATLNGSLTVGTTSTAAAFEYGTSATLAGAATVAATPAAVTGSGQAVAAALTGLTSGTTYYFRVTGTTNAGSDTEGVLTGAILSFATPGVAVQTITFDQPAAMTLGGATQTLTVATAAPSNLGVTFTSTTTGVCTVAGAVVTAVDAGTCSITASQDGDATYAPATPVTRTFAVTATARTLTIDAASYDVGGYVVTAAPPTIASTASAGGGTKTYSSTTAGVCTVDGATGVVTFVASGTCELGASITADGAHSSANATPVTFPVTAPPRTLTIDAASYDAGGYLVTATPPTIASTASAGGGTKTYSSATAGVCTVDASSGLVTLVAPGTCRLGATIAVDGAHGAATAPAIAFAVTAPATTTTTTTTAPPPATTVPPTTAPSTTVAPSTTTTVPSTTSTVPARTAPAAPSPTISADAVPTVDGSIRGVAWFDRNRNGVLDGREWILPGVAVTLTRSSAPASADGFSVAAVHAPISVITAADGSYRVTGLAPGDYRVAAAAEIEGFDYTSDTDGDPDWVVDVGVGVDGTGVADFAGLGRGALFGKMFELRTSKGLGFAAVTCRWGGFDDVLGTPDDVPFEVTAAADGTFDLRGVPYGNFTCSGLDGDGRRSASIAAAVLSPAPVEAPLPVDTPPTGGLPVTGSPTTVLVVLALGSLGAGITLVRSGRRRERG